MSNGRKIDKLKELERKFILEYKNFPSPLDKAGINAFWVLLRVRPSAILSTGPDIAVPIAILGKVLGSKIIFVETGSRVKTLSMTGRIMYRLADLFFVQWTQLAERLPRAIFAGRLV